MLEESKDNFLLGINQW